MFKYSKVVLYTAITQGKDTIREQNFDCKLVLFTDTELTSSTWEIRQIDNTNEANSVRRAKIYKVCPHRFFDDETMWIDGNVRLKVHPTTFFELLGENDMLLFRHPNRETIYEEEEAVLRSVMDDPEIIKSQMQRYREREFDGSNLAWGGFIVRRNTDKVKEFNEFWWNEIVNGSKRDQLSLPYAIWKTGIKVKYLDGHDRDFDSNEFYEKGGHNW